MRIIIHAMLVAAALLFPTPASNAFQNPPPILPPPVIPPAALSSAWAEAVANSGLTTPQKQAVSGVDLKQHTTNPPSAVTNQGVTPNSVDVSTDLVEALSGPPGHPAHSSRQHRTLVELYAHEVYHVVGGTAIAENDCAHVGIYLDSIADYCAKANDASADGKQWLAAYYCKFLSAAYNSLKDLTDPGGQFSGCTGSPGGAGPPDFGWSGPAIPPAPIPFLPGVGLPFQSWASAECSLCKNY